MFRTCSCAVGLFLAGSVGAEALYRLPWTDGLSFMFTQAPGGRITTHLTKAQVNALDISMPEGTVVLAARAGVVEAVEDGYGASPDEEPATYDGNFVRVRHADGTAATYSHLGYKGMAVAAGQAVQEGAMLGYSGFTGDITYPHLHFAVTRAERNSAGWVEEVSLPVTFYVGRPPIAFAPRAALIARADYTARAERPRTPLEAAPRAFPAPAPDEEARGWLLLAVWTACGIAGLAAFGLYSRRPG